MKQLFGIKTLNRVQELISNTKRSKLAVISVTISYHIKDNIFYGIKENI